MLVSKPVTGLECVLTGSMIGWNTTKTYPLLFVAGSANNLVRQILAFGSPRGKLDRIFLLPFSPRHGPIRGLDDPVV